MGGEKTKLNRINSPGEHTHIYMSEHTVVN